MGPVVDNVGPSVPYVPLDGVVGFVVVVGT